MQESAVDERPPFLDAQSKAGGSMLTRGLALMNVYLSGEVELSQTELARRTNLPKPTVHRLVNQLVEQGALERTRTGIRLGSWLFLLGQSVPQFSLLRASAQPCLDRLSELVRAHTCLSAMVCGNVVDIASAGPAPWRRMSDHLDRRTVSPAAWRALRQDGHAEPVVATTSLTTGADPKPQTIQLVSVAMAASVTGMPPAAVSIIGVRENIDVEHGFSHLKAVTSDLSRRLTLVALFGTE
jgi:hypothetical protein